MSVAAVAGVTAFSLIDAHTRARARSNEKSRHACHACLAAARWESPESPSIRRRRPFVVAAPLESFLAFSPSAMARSDVTPPSCSSAITGATSAARASGVCLPDAFATKMCYTFRSKSAA